MKKKAVLSRLLPYLMRYKYLMLGAILLTVGGNLLSLAGPYISGLAVDAMELGRGKVNFEKVGCYGVLMVVMYAISAALSYALTRLMIVISRRVVNTMRMMCSKAERTAGRILRYTPDGRHFEPYFV